MPISLEEVIAIIKAGQHEVGRDQLMDMLRQDRRNAPAWVWLSWRTQIARMGGFWSFYPFIREIRVLRCKVMGWKGASRFGALFLERSMDLGA